MQKFYTGAVIVIWIVVACLIGYILFDQANTRYIKPMESLKKENINLTDKVTSLEKQLSDVNRRLSSQQTNTNNYQDFLNLFNSNSVPKQSGEIKKTMDCESKIREKYRQIRVTECEKLGYKRTSSEIIINSLPNDCILPDKLHTELYQKELQEGAACGGEMYIPTSFY